MNEQELRRHLDEAHRQLVERDTVYRFHEEKLRSRDRHIEQLRNQLTETQTWARELETTIREMQETRVWRFAAWLRSLLGGPRKVIGR
jgi:hypothetical protein